MRPALTALALAALVPVTVGGCVGSSLRPSVDVADPVTSLPLLVPSPTEFDAGSVQMEEFRETVVTMWSRGDGTLRIDEVGLDGSAAWSIVAVAELPAMLAPGSRLPVTLRYEGGTLGDQRADLVVRSNVPDAPETRVPLSAYLLTPAIELDPPAIDFGEQKLGCVREQAVAVRNVGEGPLDIGAIELAGSPPGVAIEQSPQGQTLQPGEEADLVLRWLAQDLGGFATSVLVASGDPERPDVGVPSFGTARASVSAFDDHVYEEGAAAVDVLFVVDNSCSMSDEQASLGGNFSAFVDSVDGLGGDYRLAATTTDIGMGGELVGAPTVISNTTPSPADAFASNVNVGVWGSGSERGFGPASMALAGIAASPPQEGFLRPGVSLHIVFVSDEPEQSLGDTAAWVDELRSYRPSPGDTVLSAITGQASGCSGPGGSAMGAPRYETAVQMTAGISLSLCAPDWGESLESLGAAVLGSVTGFALSGEPEPGSVTLDVDGQAWPSDRWVYVSQGNYVQLQAPYPDDGAELHIEYVLWEACEG